MLRIFNMTKHSERRRKRERDKGSWLKSTDGPNANDMRLQTKKIKNTHQIYKIPKQKEYSMRRATI